MCGNHSFVEHYVNNNRHLNIEENGEHSLSWTETCFQDLRAWFIFGQPHHVRTFIFHSEEGNPTLVTRNNIRKPLGAIWLKFVQPIAADFRPLVFLLCCQLVGDPSCTPLGPTKLLKDDSKCTSVAHTKLQSYESECYSWVFYYQCFGSLHRNVGHRRPWPPSRCFIFNALSAITKMLNPSGNFAKRRWKVPIKRHKFFMDRPLSET